ncbi:LacI family transcriptional regulator [Serratia fonticola]|jgi:LacI family transcriptional regulator|uniref:LacI family transcriptional regulator n=1 Tax=Serratia fonticola TaxID=47917 RepID=A0A542CVS7_SERFO|nr:LacI family DNA-binding transcriptional regulator [Serratia fonticola]TQI78086.1 LacI family transcriptional regulator [Serratia fonticola]TQI94916.1 LacI family transcriptional regulator [Serratia fonticola]TVZ69413.1 LacI family transcriptional regulator [Serratia fonticola]
MSLKAIAKALGLSVTTVSRALNGYSDVAQDTRQRVEQEAARLGYRPNTLARRLKMGKIDAIGLVFPFNTDSLSNSPLMEMIGCISHELGRNEIDLLLVADNAPYQAFTRLIASKRVDALIVAHTLDNDPRLQELQRLDFPFLALGRSQLGKDYAWFDFDNHAGSLMAVNYLVSLGHQRIAYLGENNQQSFISQRRQGYLDGLTHHKLPLRDDHLHSITPTRRAGYLATQALLALAEPPTAIITDGNGHGEGAAMALRDAGKLGPHGVSLVVYDGLPPESLLDLPVAAIVQATRAEVGQQIAEMTLDLIRGEPLQKLQVLWQPVLKPNPEDLPLHS